MKKTTFSLLLSLACCHWLAAQCPTGDVTFSTQGQVDNFLLNYPNCDSILGSLRIGTSLDITDLSALASIRFVKKSILITGNQVLTTLSGLDSIYTFGGFSANFTPESLVIQNNDQLLNLKGLGNPLTRMATPWMNVLVADNDALTTLEGFEFLQKVGGLAYDGFCCDFPFGELKIQHNINLLSLQGLDGLEGGIVVIQDNDNLQSLEGFGDRFGNAGDAYLSIAENDTLPNLKGLDSLSKINSLYIGKNGNLQNLAGLQTLANVEGGYLYEDEGGAYLAYGLEISQ
ncbi:MAG: hypothetical protein L6Q97_06565, partial [Thermoanaerobaculia bacterium]|nr:hypothetical protein [Thermoanaerobaculia bacterium]